MEIGDTVGNYAIEAVVDPPLPGRFFVGYRARHIELGTQHYLFTLVQSESRLAADMLHGARLQASLRHQYLVNVTDLVRVGDIPGVVQDLVMGPRLRDHVQAHGPLDVEAADGLAHGLFSALEHVHLHGIVHRWIAPGTVLLDHRGARVVPRVSGFTLAKRIGVEQPERRGRPIGVLSFIPPEQAMDAESVDERADVFSACAVIYFALTGRDPIRGSTHEEQLSAARRADFEPLERLRPDLPARITAAIRNGMTADRDERPTIAEITRDWAAAQHYIPPPRPPVGDVTLVFTDVQGSTSMWERAPQAMRRVLAAHDAVMRALILKWGGHETKTQGDSFMVAFRDPERAIGWCIAVQEALAVHPWPAEIAELSDQGVVLVRMGLHAGVPDCVPHPLTSAMDYFGPAVNRAARIQSAAHGGQILTSREVVDRCGPEMAGVTFRSLGWYRFKGIEQAVELWEIRPDALAYRSFPLPNASVARPDEPEP